MTNTPPDWRQRLANALEALQGDTAQQAFLRANGQSVGRALSGAPVDGGGPRPGAGSCVVVNMASAHVPSFTADGASYKNCYDLDLDRERIGEPPRTSAKRKAVDTALEALHGRAKEDICFAAVEFNGCGVGFYGDCCLVLRDSAIDGRTRVLDRNSYDLVREPLQSDIAARAANKGLTVEKARAELAAEHAGFLSQDLAEIAAIKVLEARRPTARLLTTGMISDGVLEDEDYLEVLVEEKFSVDDVREARLTPADVALDERIHRRSMNGGAPSQAEMLWRSRRRAAEARLEALGVPVRVVTTAGRSRG